MQEACSTNCVMDECKLIISCFDRALCYSITRCRKMVETGKMPTPAKKATITPKAIIHQRFGDRACYKVEEVQGSAESVWPGLAIQQKGPCLFRCTLQLPETVVVSDTFRKKKDAEQSAAEKAIEKVCINSMLLRKMKMWFFLPSISS